MDDIRTAGQQSRAADRAVARAPASRSRRCGHLASARPAGCPIVRRRRAVLRRATARTAPPDPPPRAAIRHSRRRTGPARHGGAAPQAARRRARNTSSIPPGRCRVRVVARRAARACPWRGTRYRRPIDQAHRTPVAEIHGPVRLHRHDDRAAPWRRLPCACRSSASSSARRDRPRAANGSRVAAMRFPCTRRTAVIVDAAGQIDTQRLDRRDRLGAEKIAAHLVGGACIALDQRDGPPGRAQSRWPRRRRPGRRR